MKVYVLYGSFCSSCNGSDTLAPEVFENLEDARKRMRDEMNDYLAQWTGDSDEEKVVDDSDPDHTYVSIDGYDTWCEWNIKQCTVRTGQDTE